MPKLSIITVNLNNKTGLQRTIESVFPQTFTDYEYIIIDGGSTDGSKELIEKYQNKFVYTVSEKDTGIYQAMNKGIVKAKGDYLFFLNSGDILNSQNSLATFFNNTNGEDIVYANILIENNGNYHTKTCPPELSFRFFFQDTLPHQSTIIKKTLFHKVGLYNENLKIISDWEFFMNAICLHNATYKHIDACVSIYEENGISTHLENHEIFKKERETVLLNNYKLFIKDYRVAAEWYNALEQQKLLLEKYKVEYHIVNSKTFKLVSLLIEHPLLKFLKVPFHYCYWSINQLRFVSRWWGSFLKNCLKKLRIYIQICFPKTIPIIINSYNRLSALKQMIAFLEQKGYKNIIILDNQSTYQPLLDFYKVTTHKVIFLEKNFGHLALWESGLDRNFSDAFFVYTDPDVIPGEDCPSDFMKIFLRLRFKYPEYKKVGFGLKTDDLPDAYLYKEKVLEWEKQFWEKQIEKDVYSAQIDTTFALYAPGFKFSTGKEFYKALRTGGKYLARHLTWYTVMDLQTEEELFYKKTASKSASWTHQTNSN